MAMRAVPIDDFLDQSQEGLEGLPARTLDWHRLVAEGKAARTAADGGRWRIGQLAALVERRYASGALKRFAQDIGESVGSVRRYRWVAGAYDRGTVARFPELSFSHFQAVAGLDDRLVWLERARRGAWSVDRLVTESRHTGPAPTADVRLRRPIENASRAIATLAERLDQDRLPRGARAEIASAVDDLAAQIDALREKLNRPRRRLKIAR